MALEIISWSISTKVLDQAGMELATPGSGSDMHLQSDTLPTALHGPVLINFANSLDLDQTQQNSRPDQDPN